MCVCVRWFLLLCKLFVGACPIIQENGLNRFNVSQMLLRFKRNHKKSRDYHKKDQNAYIIAPLCSYKIQPLSSIQMQQGLKMRIKPQPQM